MALFYLLGLKTSIRLKATIGVSVHRMAHGRQKNVHAQYVGTRVQSSRDCLVIHIFRREHVQYAATALTDAEWFSVLNCKY